MTPPELKVLDCTIRDGGLLNNHHFDHRFVREVYRALCAAKVDVIELGYRDSRQTFSPGAFGPWKFCDTADLKRVIEGEPSPPSPTRLSLMVDVGKVDADTIEPASESPVHMIRVAAYAEDIPQSIPLLNELDAKGYLTTLNIMALSRDRDPDLEEGFKVLSSAPPATIIYLVDSFGALYPETTAALVERFKERLPGRKFGFHGHNNLQLAFANTLTAMLHGVEYVDGTVFGIGRAAGNCPLELLLGHLKHRAFDLAPILDLVSREFIPLRGKIEWGYLIPYALTGLLNMHPRPAMAFRQSARKDDYLGFYEELMGTGPKDREPAAETPREKEGSA